VHIATDSHTLLRLYPSCDNPISSSKLYPPPRPAWPVGFGICLTRIFFSRIFFFNDSSDWDWSMISDRKTQYWIYLLNSTSLAISCDLSLAFSSSRAFLVFAAGAMSLQARRLSSEALKEDATRQNLTRKRILLLTWSSLIRELQDFWCVSFDTSWSVSIFNSISTLEFIGYSFFSDAWPDLVQDISLRNLYLAPFEATANVLNPLVEKVPVSGKADE